MSHTIICADPHIGNHQRFGGPLVSGINTRCRWTLDALRGAVEYAAGRPEATALVVAGDVFDTAKPTPQIIRATQDVLADSRVPVYLLVGNHDRVSYEPGDHALGPLASSRVHVIETPEVRLSGDTAMLLIPSMRRAGDEVLASCLECAPRNEEWRVAARRIVVSHMGIATQTSPRYLLGDTRAVGAAAALDMLLKHHAHALYSGDWHEHELIVSPEDSSASIMQIGALCPTGFDDDGMSSYGTLVVDGPKTWGGYAAPGPRFLTFGFSDNESVLVSASLTGTLSKLQWRPLFVRARCAPDEMQHAQRILADVDPPLTGWEVIPNTRSAERAARAAAAAARNTGTLAQALARFVDAMPLPEGVARARVLQDAAKLLAGAA